MTDKIIELNVDNIPSDEALDSVGDLLSDLSDVRAFSADVADDCHAVSRFLVSMVTWKEYAKETK